MPRRPSNAALLGLALALHPLTAFSQEPQLEWVDWQELANGEVQLQTGKAGRGTVTVDAAILIDADWKTIWDILRSCDVSPEYVPNVVDCTLIDSINDGRSELFIQTVKPAFFIPKFEHVFRLDYFPPDRIDVRRVSGPIELMDGAWRLIAQDDGRTALLHSLELNPGFPVPRFFVRNTLKRDLPVILREIRARAEGTP